MNKRTVLFFGVLVLAMLACKAGNSPPAPPLVENAGTHSSMEQVEPERAVKSLAIGAGVLVYLGMLAYSGVHNYSVMTRGIEGDMVIWALLGVVALEVSAMALPLALHFWCYDTMHRIAAFSFYAVDIVLIVGNVILDNAINAGEALPQWIQIYQFYGAPIVPIIAGLGWSVLFMLDPSQKERATSETLKAATREALSARIAEQAKSADISEAVNKAAGVLARSIVNETLGVSVSSATSGENATSATSKAEQGKSANKHNGSGAFQNVSVLPLSGNGNGNG